MKKQCMAALIFVIIASFLSGCSGILSKPTAGGPGNVLGPPSGQAENQKIVTFFALGKGLEPENALSKGEAVIMAERAAVVDGYRQLVEKVRGVYVDAFMRAGRGTIDYDTIQVHTQSWLRGTEIVEISQGDYGITTARLRLRINFAKDGMVWWPVGIGNAVKTKASSTPAIDPSEV